MRQTVRQLVFLAMTMSFLSLAEAAIFGLDDRVSITPNSQGFELAKSTAVAVLSGNIEPVSDQRFKLLVDPLDKWLCPNVRFAEQPSLAYACSGFLVAPDLIVTAGHCMVNTGETKNNTEDYCKVFSWLFDYNEGLDTSSVPSANLYKCKQVIYAVRDEKLPLRDYALVQLDRPVLGRASLKMSSAELSKSDVLSAIGYPLGLPAKLSHSASVIFNDSSRQTFITNLDAFSGNSGSVVFNQKNEVVGILIGGTPMPDTVTQNQCEVYNRCDHQGKNCLEPDVNTAKYPGFQAIGTEVQRIAPVVELVRGLIKNSK